jgi:hypothetical protein
MMGDVDGGQILVLCVSTAVNYQNSVTRRNRQHSCVTDNPRFGLLFNGQSEIGRFGLIRSKCRLRRGQDRPQ